MAEQCGPVRQKGDGVRVGADSRSCLARLPCCLMTNSARQDERGLSHLKCKIDRSVVSADDGQPQA